MRNANGNVMWNLLKFLKKSEDEKFEEKLKEPEFVTPERFNKLVKMGGKANKHFWEGMQNKYILQPDGKVLQPCVTGWIRRRDLEQKIKKGMKNSAP